MGARLFIFGTGAHARKVYHCAKGCGYEFAAFVDENPVAVAPIPGELVFSIDALSEPAIDDCIFVAIGRPEARRRLMDLLTEQGWCLPALVHDAAWVAPDVQLGAGVLVAAGAVVETGAVIGRGVIVDIGVIVDHECNVGAFVTSNLGKFLGLEKA